MLHARKDYNRIQDPENKIPEDEPVFLLRASDMNAPDVLEYWCDLASSRGAGVNITEAAYTQSKKMREWQANHGSKIPDMP